MNTYDETPRPPRRDPAALRAQELTEQTWVHALMSAPAPAPSVRVNGVIIAADEGPCLIIAGRKRPVEGIY